MFLSDQPNYYEILEITPDATPTEIRSAYLKMKSAYSKDSVATYSLVSRDEMDDIVRKIEEAHNVLSSLDRRKEYDRKYQLGSVMADTLENNFKPTETAKVISIDRVPPMDTNNSSEHMLVAPTTDFETKVNRSPSVVMESTIQVISTAPTPSHHSEKSAVLSYGSSVIDAANFQLEMDRETDWKGSFIRRVRELKKISLEELADYTKVSRTYLRAIENDEYNKLPAPVFLRGFLIQLCRKLHLPQDRVISAFLDRYKKNCPDKF